MTTLERLAGFQKLGIFINDVINDAGNDARYEGALKGIFSEVSSLIDEVHIYNGWFTKQNIVKALGSISKMLNKEALEKWIIKYPSLTDDTPCKSVGVIMAGNIPLVGFHDFLCVLISGNKIIAKLSSDDDKLLPLIAKALVAIEPRYEPFICFADGKLEKIDAVIATGSNNSARYFEYYFAKYPNVIRKNRNSVAVLTGNETQEELNELGKDIFQYYGLGCRNVSKLMIPESYDLAKFFEGIYNYGYVMDNKKYANNYEYNRTVYLMNSLKFLDNNFIAVKEDIGIASPVGVLYYERYKDKEALKAKLKADANNIQCLVSSDISLRPDVVSFGNTQTPSVVDYADGVDVLNFLTGLN